MEFVSRHSTDVVGYYIYRWVNGNIESEGFEMNNEMVGYWRYYYTNGNLESEVFYL